jgi:hypothetical protein
MDGDHGVAAVKNCYPNGNCTAFLQSAFPEIYCDRAPAAGRAALALSGSRRYISLEFPDKACCGALAHAGGFGPQS